MSAKTEQRLRQTQFPVVNYIAKVYSLRSCILSGVLNVIRGKRFEGLEGVREGEVCGRVRLRQVWWWRRERIADLQGTRYKVTGWIAIEEDEMVWHRSLNTKQRV